MGQSFLFVSGWRQKDVKRGAIEPIGPADPLTATKRSRPTPRSPEQAGLGFRVFRVWGLGSKHLKQLCCSTWFPQLQKASSQAPQLPNAAKSRNPYEAGFILLFLVSVYKVPFNIGECIYRVSFWGYKKCIPYFI